MRTIKPLSNNLLLQAALLVIALISFGATTVHYPLVDYDEATYAKVTMDTLASGDVLSLSKSGTPWFEKPPLYFWLTMGAVKVFGEHEFAFRIPSVAASLAALVLVYLLTKELTDSSLAAAIAFLVLLFTPPFFVFAREARLDSGVIMAILAALFFCIRGWRKEKYLFWIFPALAIGFLFKSVVALLAIPLMLLYSIGYRQWAWLKSRQLWRGISLAFLVLAPWHILQSLKFGMDFWNSYIFQHVFERAVSTITGTGNYYDYLNILWRFFSPWLWVVLGCILFLMFMRLRMPDAPKYPFPQKHVFVPLFSAVFIIVLFTMARTHLSTYIMPAFPFFARFVAIAVYYFSLLFRKEAIAALVFLLVCLVAFGAFKSFRTLDALVKPWDYEERDIGMLYKKANARALNGAEKTPLYVLDWPRLETLAYYGDAELQHIDPRTVGGRELKAPFYLVTHTNALNYLKSGDRVFAADDERVRELYSGKVLVLFYSDKDMTLPQFE
jgi:4-amino-4-deoxy-L-arabinose transferase-like glycosyltransferase